ncbi:MAG: hypothetical protein FD180_149 [Planctomycetota bacterium]|nr:MAG: hypothetical protein FD180_149 [Planctomycetota bacterium]
MISGIVSISKFDEAPIPVHRTTDNLLGWLREHQYRLHLQPQLDESGATSAWGLARHFLYEVKDETFVPISVAVPWHGVRLQLSQDDDGLMASSHLALIPIEVANEVDERLKSESDEVRLRSCWPLLRCFVYLDISDYSTYPPGQQALIVASLTKLVEAAQRRQHKESTGTPERAICSGDGYIFLFLDPGEATWFAAQLATEIEHAVAKKSVPVEFHFRMGIHIGEVFPFEEAGQPSKWNYAGDGINGGRRVLDAIGPDADDLVFLSGEVLKAIRAESDSVTSYSEILDYLVNRGRKKDKHGRAWRVFELNHRDAAAGTG